MEEKLTKEKLEPLENIIKKYFIEAYHLCEGDRVLVAEKLGISIRTVGIWSEKYSLPNKHEIRRTKKVDEPIKTKKQLLEEFMKRVKEQESQLVPENKMEAYKEYGYRDVTPEERDEWYSRDRF